MKLLCSILLSCALLLQAEETTQDVYPRLKIGAKEYVNVQVLSVNPSGLKVRHDSGGGLIRFTDLPAVLQKKYGYDPAKAAAHDRALQAEQQKALEGIEKEREAIRAREVATVASVALKYPVVLNIVRVLPEGCLCAYRMVYRTEDTARYSLGYLMSGSPSTLAVTGEAEELMLVTGLPGLLVDGTRIAGFITATDTYSYETLDGNVRTVYRCEYSPPR